MNPILARYRSALPFSVQERDIDLLLIEQLHVSGEFAEWLLGRLNLRGGSIETAHHSVYREHGETDVLVMIMICGERVALMIEDKIGAPMQPNQCERYHLRGEALRTDGTAGYFKTVLCAPSSYLAGVRENERWDHRLSLEEIAEAIKDGAYPGWEWRHAILIAAASRLTRAREADNKSNHTYDSVIAPLKKSYRKFVNAHYPHLHASVQEGRDREYYLKASGLPPGIRFKHAFFRGEVSLIFEKAWAQTAEHRLQGMLPEGTWAVPHGSEFHVRQSVEVMDPQLPFEQQQAAVAAALDKIKNMVGLGIVVANAGPSDEQRV